MVKKRDYNDWSKEDLVREVEALRKQKTYGLVWDTDKTKEVFDYYINWDGVKNKEDFKEAEGKFPVLKEVKGKDITTKNNGLYNVLIEGDNYHSLAVLDFTHEKAIDVIYIDPPYNTGNREWKYNDDWIDREDTYRHSKWLSFMEKRLKLARSLLKDTGAIFISIDGNELAQLKILCDEIFREKNLIGVLIWRKKEGGGQADQYFVTEHEYILAYARSDKFEWLEDVVPANEGDFNKQDENGKYRAVRLAKWGNAARKEDRLKMWFPIKAPDGKNICPKAPDGGDGRWRVGRITMDELIKDQLIEWQKKNGEWIAYEKIYFSENEVKKIKERSILYDLAGTSDGTNELTKIFGIKDIFQNPKPKELIKYLLIHASGKNAVILDFFAGSGTTGQAVLELNKEDNGTRQFILCTNNELNEKIENEFKKRGIKKGSLEYEQEGVCQKVCYPRLEKVIRGYTASKDEKIDELGSNLKYFKTDFVESAPTDKNKKKLVDKSTEMICIKENAFELVKDGAEEYKIFKNCDINLGIIFNSDAIEDFVKEAKKIAGKFHIYVFSFDDTVPEFEFRELKGRIRLCAIPEAILHVYRRVFKND